LSGNAFVFGQLEPEVLLGDIEELRPEDEAIETVACRTGLDLADLPLGDTGPGSDVVLG
jgi:hypothetical protein